jgi:hypothetical protein
MLTFELAVQPSRVVIDTLRGHFKWRIFAVKRIACFVSSKLVLDQFLVYTLFDFILGDCKFRLIKSNKNQSPLKNYLFQRNIQIIQHIISLSHCQTKGHPGTIFISKVPVLTSK